jgi:iron complex outermembrane recepter protein
MSKRLFQVILASIAVLMVALGNAAFLHAQESTPEEFTLEEITVTAQKRAENQQKVPIAMDVISDKDLAGEGKNNVEEILSALSNVLINTDSDGMRVAIRGLADYGGTAMGMKTSTPTVAVNIDGAQNDMASAGNNLFDVERVEVLYGPQSTMYSSNSPGGIVNVITTAPKPDLFSANASYERGSYSLSNLQLAVNVPILTDKLAIRLSGSDSGQGTWVEGSSPSKNKAVRLKTLWNATDNLSVTLTGNLSKANNGGMFGGRVKAFVDQDDDTYPDGTTLTNPWTSSGNDFGPGSNTNDQVTKGLNGNVAWDTSLGALTVTTNYSKSTAEGWQTQQAMAPPDAPPGSGTAVTSFNQMMFKQKGAEARMASANDFILFKWIGGVSYYDYNNDRASTQRSDGTEDQHTIISQKNKAVFANITYPLWFYDKFSLTFGYRQSWDDVAHTGQDTANENMKYNKPDFKYGFQWDISDNMMIYGSYASSYRVDAMGTFGLWDSKTQTFNAKTERPPEENRSYSIGMKSRMLDNTVQLNASAFYYDYRNSWANDSMKSATLTRDEFINASSDTEYNTWLWDYGTTTRDGRGNLLIQEARNNPGYYSINEPNFHKWGDMTSKGLDVSINWVASAKDMMSLSVSYLDSEWSGLTFDYMFSNVWTPFSCNGIQSPNSSKWSITASYEHNFELGGFGMLIPHIDLQHKTEYNLVFDTTETVVINGARVKDPGYYYQEPYNVYNASIAFQPNSSIWKLSWSLNAYVKNITNYAVKKSYDMGGGPNAVQSLMIGDPRTYGATISIKF